MGRIVMVACLASLVAASTGAEQKNAEVTFQAAMAKQMIEGDLTGAIVLFEQVVSEAGSNRDLAARALLRMGECYQKLGHTQARKTYERVVREFPDQKDVVALARTRLGQTANDGSGDRVLWAGAEVWGDGTVSLDGRYISSIDWTTGNLLLRDVAAGTTRVLLDSKEWTIGNANTATFSPDGKGLAYGWRTYEENGNTDDVRILDLERRGALPRKLYANDDVNVFPTDWSRDGKWLATVVERTDLSKQISLMNVQDASVRALKTVGWRGPNKVLFSPDGRYIAYDLPANENSVQRDVFIMAVDATGETLAVEHAAHDVLMAWSPDGRHLLFASDRTGSMSLWALPVRDGKRSGAPALVKPDIGSVQSLGVTSAGVLHLVKDASTESLQLAPFDPAAGRITGPSVLENFRSFLPAWSRDGRSLAYAHIGSDERRALAIRSVDSGQVRYVRPELQYFNEPQWMPDGRSVVTTGRGLNGRWGIFQIDVTSGKHTLLTDADLCRVQVSPDGAKVYYEIGRVTLGEGEPTRVMQRDLPTGATREIFRKREGPEGNFALSPKGDIFASIRMDPATKASVIMLTNAVDGSRRELIRLAPPETFTTHGNHSWTPDGNALLVMRSGPQGKSLWLVPIDGTGPRKLDVDVREWSSAAMRVHPSGEQLAFFTGESSREVWALDSYLPALKRQK